MAVELPRVLKLPVTTLGPAHPTRAPVAARPRLPSAHAALTAILCLGTLIAWWTPPADVSVVTWRVCVLLTATIGAWALGALADYAVAIAFLAIYHAADLGPPSAGLSGFASPTWFLVVGVFALGVALRESGLLERLVVGLVRFFPGNFTGRVVGMVVCGVAVTPLLPLAVARCALFGALAARVSRELGYGPGTAGARGVGLAAFLGAGLLCRSFLSGAGLNLVAWGLLPTDAQLTWTAWAVAALPTTAIVFAGGVLAILFSARTSPVRAGDAIQALEQPTAVARGEWITGAVLAITMTGFVVAPRFEVHMAWVVWAGVTVLCMTGTLSRESLRSGVDWPLVIFLGVILSLAGVVTHAGLDGHVAALAQRVFPGSYGSTAVNVTVLYAVVLAARIVLSEWIAVPLLTVALVPVAPLLGLGPWPVAFVILTGANLWALPYQFTSYVGFVGGADTPLFSHRAAFPFAVASLVLSWLGLLASIPWWRALGLLAP